MTPAEFIDRLSRHYAKRHESTQAQSLWLREMVDCVKGTDPALLERAFELIRDEHEERAFPLPATLKRYITRAGEQVYPESQASRGYNTIDRPVRKAHVAPEMQAIYDRAAVWQKQTMDQYGSWAAHWSATRHLHKNWTGPKVEPRQVALPSSLALGKVRRMTLRKADQSVDRIVMEAMQNRSRNTNLHRELSGVTRRMTGERE